MNKVKQVRQGARAFVGETEFLKNLRKSNDLYNAQLMERKFS